MNAYNSFCASIDDDGGMYALCRFPNDVTLLSYAITIFWRNLLICFSCKWWRFV